jgi:hypothetical protein
LKAIGAQQHCDWPAAPLDLQKTALKARNLNPAEKTALGGGDTVAAGSTAPNATQR